MGMFNTVEILLPCPKCGKMLGEWQTKDDHYDTLYCELVLFWTVREFHTICDKCDSFISVKLKKERLKDLTVEKDYDIIVVPLGKTVEELLNERSEENSTSIVPDRDNLESKS